MFPKEVVSEMKTINKQKNMFSKVKWDFKKAFDSILMCSVIVHNMIDGTPCYGWDYYNGMIEALNKNGVGKIRKRTRPPAVIFFRLALHCLVQHYSNPDFLSELFDNIYPKVSKVRS